MTAIREGLPDASFVRPEGIVEREVCSRTGGLATSRCRNTYVEISSQKIIYLTNAKEKM